MEAPLEMTGKNLTRCVLWLAAFVIQAAPHLSFAATYQVPGDFELISEALAVAQTGDRIEVAPGTYYETGLVMASGVALVGLGTLPERVVIDGQSRGRILLAEGLDQSTLIANITFSNGRASGHASYERSGGAIFCSNSAMRIYDCTFTGNISDGSGGAIRCNNSAPLITGCVFTNNESVSGGGGAIDCSFNSSPLIRGSEFRDNVAAWGGSLSCRGNSSPVVQNTIFTSNDAVGSKGYGGAVFADYGSAPTFRQTTFNENTARYGGAIACLSGAETNLENSTVVNNSALLRGGGIFIYDAAPRITASIIAFQEGAGIIAEGGAAPQITCTDIYGNSSGDWVGNISTMLATNDNINADPLFCESGGGVGRFPLTDNSPCNAEDLDCGYMGAWPVGCDALGTTVSAMTSEWDNLTAQLSWQAESFGGTSTQFRLLGSSDAQPGQEWEVAITSLGGGYYEAADAASNGNSGETYSYQLLMSEDNGDWTLVTEVEIKSTPSFPNIAELSAAPNPFNPMTTISFRLGESQRARISVYSASGRRLAVLADRVFDIGRQEQSWNGQDSQGRHVASGTYIVLVEGEKEQKTLKITMLK
ncbi:MAG: putative outer membrane repeat protein [Candidatus Krumholzibacteriia bacterium]|jgi:predicted outer membrane repeat protein